MQYKFKPLFDQKILETSNGEVTSVGVYDTRRDRPTLRGLQCEQIFGPMRNHECSCAQLRGIKNHGQVCKTCGVLCDWSAMRNVLWGHIDLQIHVISPLLVKVLGKMIGIPIMTMQSVIAGDKSIEMVEVDQTEGFNGEISIRHDGVRVGFQTGVVDLDIPEDEFEVNTGPEAVWRLVRELDTAQTLELRFDRSSRKYAGLVGFEIHQLFNRYWAVPPADLRPFSISQENQLDTGVNALYRRILRHVNALAYNLVNTPEHRSTNALIVIKSLLIQKGINGLVKDGAKVKKFGSGELHVPSILASLCDKSGRMRGTVLGKRVDFSGRSAISVDPSLHIDQAGVPEKMAVELFRPFIIADLQEQMHVTYGTAYRWWAKRHPRAYESLKRIVDREDAPLVLLNRAPSLHRYSVMALRVKLHPGKSLRIHPGICAPYNADFDGDTMAVHMILSAQANAEARALLMPQASILGSRNGSPTFGLSHEAVVGMYFLTYEPEDLVGKRPLIRRSRTEVVDEYYARYEGPEEYRLRLQQPVALVGGTKSTIGRLIVEDALDVPTGYLQFALDKGTINKVIKYVNETDSCKTSVLRKIEKLTALGFKYGTDMGLSICADHLQAPSTREAIIEEGEAFEKADNSMNKEASVRNWAKLTSRLEKDYLSEQSEENPIRFMYQTKARVSLTQIRQMAIWKGQIADPSGGVVMIRESLKDGIGPFPYMLSCKGTRQSLGANNDVVPQSGYFCRQLVNSSRDLYVMSDEGTANPFEYCADRAESGIEFPVINLHGNDAVGRYQDDGVLITSEMVKAEPNKRWSVLSPINSLGKIRQIDCGIDPATNLLTRVGTPIGVVAGQSIAEPTTQLGLRSKHLAGAIDIAEDTLNKVTFVKSGTITAIEDTADYTKLTVVAEEDNTLLTYYWHHNHEHLAKTLHELPRRSFAFREFKVGETVEAGEVAVVYADDLHGADISGTLSQVIKLVGASNPGKTFNYPTALVAPVSGILTYAVKRYHDEEIKMDRDQVSVLVDGFEVGKISQVAAILAPEGSWVIPGQQLTHGLPDIATLWKATSDISMCWWTFYNSISNLMGTSGISIASIHYEAIFRAMVDLHEVEDEFGTKMITRDNATSFAGVQWHGVNQVPQKYPSVFRSIGYGHINKRIEKALGELEVSAGTPTEVMMAGGRIPSPFTLVETKHEGPLVYTVTIDKTGEVVESGMKPLEGETTYTAVPNDGPAKSDAA